MTTDCRNTWVNYFQCKQATSLVELNKSLSYNICPDKNLKNNAILSMLIDVIASYVTFEDDVYLAYSIAITKPEEGTTGVVHVDINGIRYTGSSTGDASDLAEALATDLEAGNFETYVVDNTVYVWSYTAALEGTFEGSSSNAYADSTDTNLIDDLGEILDLWNCMSLEEVCNIIQYTKKYINLKCRC